MNYVTNMFLLVSSSVRSKQPLCFVHGQGQKSEQKPTTKKVVGLPNHSPLLTMIMDSLYYQLSNSWSFGPKAMLYISEYPMRVKVFHDVAMNNMLKNFRRNTS